MSHTALVRLTAAVTLTTLAFLGAVCSGSNPQLAPSVSTIEAGESVVLQASGGTQPYTVQVLDGSELVGGTVTDLGGG